MWTEPTCDLADEQRSAGTTLSCQWDTLDAVVLAVDGEPIPTDALIVVVDGAIAELHLGYGRPDFATLGAPFGTWMEIYHPDIEGADCCDGDTREESVQRGKLRAQWANEWATFLDTYGCTATAGCRISIEEWLAEYDAQCLALDPPDIPTPDLVDHMRAVPPPSPDKTLRDALGEADATLLDPGNTAERIAELQQTRLEVMTQLGIDESCRPAPA